MKWKIILMVSVLSALWLGGMSLAAEKKAAKGQAASGEKVFTGESRGGDGVGRVFWIRAGEGQPDQTFTCDDKSLLITAKGQKAFSEISSKEFIELFKTNERVTVKYVEKNGKKWVKTIGSATLFK